ncbi:7898_t:CDS:2 [Funneliformis mosseae]|uniref:7898_t:CDS:1 n=1 Tax=Funneliformis mosseae TaxID=27381 RepID=A0A9N8UZE4_FUNMO|nr:7898_t:CDS:2 [Funneliformis mosseae]
MGTLVSVAKQFSFMNVVIVVSGFSSFGNIIPLMNLLFEIHKSIKLSETALRKP